jgi:molybdopterin converting factor small subunit
MRITVLLGGHLRTEAHKGPMERIVELPDQARGVDLAAALGLPDNRVKMIFVNSRANSLSTLLHDGDRVALFPPELSYNTFVALSYRQDRIEESK